MPEDPYLIPGTDCLKNKLGITDKQELVLYEEKYSLTRAAGLRHDPAVQEGELDLNHLKAIHRHLFQDVYEWAGEIRSVNIMKAQTFALSDHIEPYGNSVFKQLEKENHLQDTTQDQFAERLSYYFGEINALHCFREGNGRTQRAFIDELAGRAGFAVDWKAVSREEMIKASIDSMAGDLESTEKMFQSIVYDPTKKTPGRRIASDGQKKDIEPDI